MELDNAFARSLKEEIPCKGVFARYSKEVYAANTRQKGFFVKEGFKILKRRSCPGCEKCGWLYDDLRESYSSGFPINHSGALSHGDIVMLSVKELGRDWETGIVDEWVIWATKVD